MSEDLQQWETLFVLAANLLERAQRQKPGTLLRVVPERGQWQEFISTAQTGWPRWQSNLSQYPHALLVLFGGLAFYEYDDNTFWPLFAKALKLNPISANHQSKIGSAYCQCSQDLGFPVLEHNHSTSYVGTAICHIGIPLSLWDGFLESCEWARCVDNWQELPDADWSKNADRLAGSRKRLKRFMVENRQIASSFIKEMLDAREILKDDTLSISSITQACFLRPEYFEEVPETAEFLRPQDPDSLLKGRAKVIWDDRRNVIALYLPPVAQDYLPAEWQIGGLITQAASADQDETAINFHAFTEALTVTLRSNNNTRPETQRIKGLGSWALFDLESKTHINVENRQYLPIRSYALVSKDRLTDVRCEGFADEENLANELYELSDGSMCYITRLWPIGKMAKVRFLIDGKQKELLFKSRTRIETRFYAGEDRNAANFLRIAEADGEWIKIEKLPILCVAVPLGYLKDPLAALSNKFRVLIDARPARGLWEKCHSNEDHDFFIWRWDATPYLELKKGGRISDFRELSKIAQPPKLQGRYVLAIQSEELGLRSEYRVDLVQSKAEISQSWKDFPGACLPWALLCQSRDGMNWESLLLAKDVIAKSSGKLSYFLLKKYGKTGVLIQQGRQWVIGESRVVLSFPHDAQCEMNYIGDPTILWGLYRKMYHRLPGHKMPVVNVINKWGELPFLQIQWPGNLAYEVKNYLQRFNVKLVRDLWNP